MTITQMILGFIIGNLVGHASFFLAVRFGWDEKILDWIERKTRK